MKKLPRILVPGLALTLLLSSTLVVNTQAVSANTENLDDSKTLVESVYQVNSLKDIPSSSSAEISFLLEKSIVTGYPNNTFQPTRKVTRGEAATMIGRALGYRGEKTTTSFSDVASNYYASGYIAQAAANGVIGGYPDGTFQPQKEISRGEMSALLTRAFPLTKSVPVTFTDVPKGYIFESSIARLVGNGLTNGYPDGTFRPNNQVTREEFALFVARALEDSFRVEISTESPIGQKVVTADVLNVRSGPSTTNSIIGKLYEGTKVDVYRTEGSWSYIGYGALRGYVSSTYLIDASQQQVKRYIAIDPGHGGKDPGAVGNGLKESEVVLDVSKKVQTALEKKNISVFMTRSTDVFLELDERVKVAVDAKVDAFVSIHANSFTNTSANGTETYYAASLPTRAEASKQLATFIQNRLYKALGTNNRGVKEGGFRVIKSNPLPAALVELGFISNTGDATKLATQENRQKAADAIAAGIEDYYNWRENK